MLWVAHPCNQPIGDLLGNPARYNRRFHSNSSSSLGWYSSSRRLILGSEPRLVSCESSAVPRSSRQYDCRRSHLRCPPSCQRIHRKLSAPNDRRQKEEN